MTWHIASLIVRCRPEHEAAVCARLGAFEHIDIRAAESGKIVVLAEGANEFELARRFDAIRASTDVMTVDLVHHEIDFED